MSPRDREDLKGPGWQPRWITQEMRSLEERAERAEAEAEHAFRRRDWWQARADELERRAERAEALNAQWEATSHEECRRADENAARVRELEGVLRELLDKTKPLLRSRYSAGDGMDQALTAWNRAAALTDTSEEKA